MHSTIPKRPDSYLLGGIKAFRLPTALSISDHNSAYQPPPKTTGKRKAARSSTSRVRLKNKVATIMKTPDYAYQPKGAPYPTVVLEVGWTEHPDELYSDAEQWLVKTSGQVQLVITVRFIEYNSPLAEHRKELMNLMSEEVDGVDEDSNSDGALSPAPSTDSDHTLERQQIDPNQ